jgi:hypothetical protein
MAHGLNSMAGMFEQSIDYLAFQMQSHFQTDAVPSAAQRKLGSET